LKSGQRRREGKKLVAGKRVRQCSVARRSAAGVAITSLVVLGASVGTAHAAETSPNGTTLGLSVEVDAGVSMLDSGRVRISSSSVVAASPTR
jgi:hypothetical protein